MAAVDALELRRERLPAAAIVAGLEKLSGPKLWKNPRGDLQYTTSYWNQDGGGKPICVLDLPSALEAIQTIVEQGEGADPDDPTSK
jgi:hypothetical protein